MNYAELIAALPLPTVEQTAAFAEHVADNHSWYKHLPFFPPGATFAFFLNPHAGEEIRREGDRYTARPIEDGDYFRHHSRDSTPHYRERFGHWDYWVDNPRGFDRPEGPFLYGTGPDGRAPVPPELVRRWSCRLTAFLRHGPMLRSELFDTEHTTFAEYARLHPTDPDVERYRHLRGTDGYGQFQRTEIPVQRQLALQTLLMVRDDCARMLRTTG